MSATTRLEKPSVNLPSKPSLCVELELYAKSVSAKRADLYFSINFFVSQVAVPGGVIHVGLRQANLNVRLENAEMPLRTRGLVQELPLTVEIKRKETSIGKRASSKDHELGGKLDASGPDAAGIWKLSRITLAKIPFKPMRSFPLDRQQFSPGGVR